MELPVPKNSFSRGPFSNRRQYAHLHSLPHFRLIINFLSFHRTLTAQLQQQRVSHVLA